MSFQNKQLPVGHGDPEQVLQGQACDMAEDDPDHPGMGHKDLGAGFPEAVMEKRQYPVLEVQKAFPVRGPEGVQVFSPLFEPVRVLLFDFLKRPAVPLPQVDFMQCRVRDDGPVTRDDPCCMPAPGEAAGVDDIDVQRVQGLVPVSGLGDAFAIQARVCASDEPLFTGSVDPAVPQQEYQAVSL